MEIAFLLSILAAYLDATGRRRLLSPLKWGILVAIAALPALTYAVESFLERELLEGFLNLLAIPAILGLLFWIRCSFTRFNVGSKKADGPLSLLPWCLVFISSLLLASIKGLEMSLALSRELSQSTTFLIYEVVSRLGTSLTGVAIAALAGAILYKLIAEVGTKWISSMAIVAFLIFFIQEAVASLQLMLVRNYLPLMDWLFRLLVPLINNYWAFYYALFAASSILMLLAAWEIKKRKHISEGFNPAMKRKLKVALRRKGTLLRVTVILLLLVIFTDGAGAVYASRSLELSPATPVASQDDRVMIPINSVSDGKLHKFSFAAPDGTVLHFLIIHKGSGIYGVALDACRFCGVSGYRQDKKNIICNRCNAAINIATIGFPGGCNPIPLESTKEDDSIVIPIKVLEEARVIFSK